MWTCRRVHQHSEELVNDTDHLQALYESIMQIHLQDALESLSVIVDSSFR